MQQPPGRSGLYDPRFEHDACGVSFVANIKGVRQPRVVRIGLARCQPGAPRRHRRRGRHRRRRRHPGPGPDRFLRACRRVGFELPPAGAYAVGLAFLPADPSPPRRRRRRSRRSSPTRASPSSAGATCPSTRAASAPAPARRCRRFRQLFVADPAGATGIDLDRKVFIVRKRIEHELDAELRTYFPSLSAAPSSTRGCSPRRSCRRSSPTSPTSASRARCCWSTAASPPTRSRRGRWPTRTATSPTTARSTPCRATGTGCAPARRCWRAPLLPGLERAFPICTPGGSDTARSTRCSSCSTSAGARCPTPC